MKIYQIKKKVKKLLQNSMKCFFFFNQKFISKEKQNSIHANLLEEFRFQIKVKILV